MSGIVRQERTFSRDLSLSQRHRHWGYDCPAVDIDFLLVEYNEGRPAALVEYKHLGAPMPNLQSPTFRAVRTLADATRIPFLLVYYSDKPWWFRLYPANAQARDLVPPGQIMSEREYVEGLYKLRGVPTSALDVSMLSTYRPGA